MKAAQKLSLEWKENLAFLLGLLITVLSPPAFLVARSSFSDSPVVSVFFFALGVATIVGFSLFVSKQRSLRDERTLKALKMRHRRFFERTRSDLAHLLEKGGTDERFLHRDS
jgi:hypothetical protein